MRKIRMITVVLGLLLSMAGCSLLQGIPGLGGKEPIRTITIPFSGETTEEAEPVLVPEDNRIPAGILLVEEEGIRITLDSYEEGGSPVGNAPIFHLTVRNDTLKDIRVTAPCLCLNNFVLPNSLDAEVKAGTEVRADLEVCERLYRELYFQGAIQELAVDFVILSAETGEVLLQPEPVQVQLPASGNTAWPKAHGGLVLYMGKDGLTVTLNGWYMDRQEAGYDAVLCIVNPTEEYIACEIHKIRIGADIRISRDGSTLVPPGRTGFASVFVSKEEAREAGYNGTDWAGAEAEILSGRTLLGEKRRIAAVGTEPEDQLWPDPMPETAQQEEDSGFLLLNRDGVTIRADHPVRDTRGYEWSVGLRVRNTGEESIRFGISAVYADGCLLNRKDVPMTAEKKTEAAARIVLSSKDLEPYGMKKVLNLTVRAYIEKEDGTRTEGELLVLPVGTGENTYERPAEGEPVLDTENTGILLTKAEPGTDGGIRFTFFLENRTDRLVRVELTEGETVRDSVWLPAKGAALRKVRLEIPQEASGEKPRLAFRILDQWDQETEVSEPFVIQLLEA